MLTGLTGLRWRRTLPAATALALAAAGSLGTTFARGVSAGELPAARTGDVTVLAANVFLARADREGVARLAVDGRADVVSLPESTREYADDVATRIERATGTGVQVFFRDDRDGRFGTALLVADRLGEYRATGELTDGVKAVVTAAPVSGQGPVLAAAHTAAPVPELLAPWAVEVQAVADWCARTPGALLAGDLNATLDHPGCTCAGPASTRGSRRAPGRGAPGRPGTPPCSARRSTTRWPTGTVGGRWVRASRRSPAATTGRCCRGGGRWAESVSVAPNGGFRSADASRS